MNLRRLHCCVILATLGLLLASTGCRNRGPFLANNSFRQLGGPTTVAPPNTYSLQIPGQQNLNQGSGVRQATNIQPNNLNVQSGWQPAGATTNQGIQSQPTPPQGSTSSTNFTIFNRPTTQTVAVTPNRQNNPIANTRVAQNTSGLSFTDRTNFRTTAVDERLDQSRLPVTDASQVRAPTNFSPATTVGQFNTPYYVPNQQPVNNIAPQYQNTQQRFVTNPQTGQIINPNLAQSGPTTVVGAFGQPVFMQPPQNPYSGLNTRNQVLAQSTVYADPANDPNIQAGWTNPELTASRSSVNR